MKVAIVGSRGYPSNYGGFESFVKQLSERLVSKNIQVTVYCHRALFEDRPRKRQGVDLVYLPAIETKILSQLTHSFLSIVHASFSKAEIILVLNSANGPFGWIPKLFGKRTVINVDGMEWLRPKWKGIGARYFYFAARLATRFYDEVVSDAEEMRKVYLDHFGKDSTVIAYGAPNIDLSNPSNQIKERKLQKGEYYLIVGRLIPDNNAKLIAEGFMKSRSRRKLVIVGGVPYKDEYVDSLKLLSNSDERLIITGHIDDRGEIAQLFQNAYMYVHGHEFGGTNPTMIEALGYGCAILALDTRFNKEMLQDRKYGAYFEKDIDNIRSQFDHWDTEDSTVDRMRKNAALGVTEKYKWDHVCDQYIELFSQLARSK